MDSSAVFLPKHPLNLLQDGTFNRVPWIVGVNEMEGIVVSAARELQFSPGHLVEDYIHGLIKHRNLCLQPYSQMQHSWN